MNDRATANLDTGSLGAGTDQLLQFSKRCSEEMLKVNKELLQAYQDASQAWVNRVKSEVEFWSELANKLAASRSVPEGLEKYRDGIAHRVQIAAEDGRRMYEESQKLIAAVTNSASSGFSAKGKKG